MRKCIVLATLLAGCSLFDGDGRVTGTWAGVYHSSFESSNFRLCNTDQSWWLQSEIALPDIGRDTAFGGSQTMWLKATGVREGPGSYGHLSAWDYQFTVTAVVAASPDSSGAICP